MANWLSSGDWPHYKVMKAVANNNIHSEMPFFIPNYENGCPEFLDRLAAEEEGRGGGGGVVNASRSHCEAEKRRRDRINAQLSALRNFIPMSDKMDKATLLSNVVEHVKEMKKKATNVSQMTLIPSDIDEVLVDHVNNGSNKNGIFLKASISCDDRPELFSELNNGLKSLRLTIVEADMITIGGRVKNIFLLHANKDNVEGGNICINAIKHSLKVVLSRIATSRSTSNYPVKSKRQRFFFPSH